MIIKYYRHLNGYGYDNRIWKYERSPDSPWKVMVRMIDERKWHKSILTPIDLANSRNVYCYRTMQKQSPRLVEVDW